jgi:hypothetical protein
MTMHRTSYSQKGSFREMEYATPFGNTLSIGLLIFCRPFSVLKSQDAKLKEIAIHLRHMAVVVIVVVTGKDETPDIEDLGSVLRVSSIQTLRLPKSVCSHLGSHRSDNEVSVQKCNTYLGRLSALAHTSPRLTRRNISFAVFAAHSDLLR